MKKLVFTGILLLSITVVTAQTISIEKTYRPMEQKGFHPQFNTTGDQLAFTSESYVGLDVYNFSEKSTVKVTEEAGAGFQPVFSNNNEKIFYKHTTYESRLRKEGVKSFDLSTQKRVEMLQPRRGLKQPKAFQNGFLVLADNKLLKTTFGASKVPASDYIWSDGSNLYIYRNNEIKILNPVKGANGYIWSSLSPNGKMILFTAAGQGTYVSDLEGKIIAKLGYLNAPVWYDDNFVVGMQDKDDGQFVTGSKILMKSLDGKTEKTLSAAGQIAMYPSAAAIANRVAFNTLNGEIYVVELKIYR
jgi:Tol biopolymer transport system component